MAVLVTMLKAHPRRQGPNRETLAECMDACLECVAICTVCADACLSEEGVAELRDCIRTNLDCADICGATARVLARMSDLSAEGAREQVRACAMICAACAAVCEGHAAMHEHCKVCAEACRRCEESCSRAQRVV